MPPATRRSGARPDAARESMKRSRVEATSERPSKRTRTTKAGSRRGGQIKSDRGIKVEDDHSNPFGNGESADVIDLTEDTVHRPGLEHKAGHSVKLSAFQCVICMDNVTNISVTHCGHLFCGECLHSALNIDRSKRTCPVCRQKIDPIPGTGKFGIKSKGFWTLELQLMTKKKLGKQPA